MDKPIAKDISYTKNNVTEYASQIATAWHKATESILEVGRLLLDAKEELSTIEFRELKRGLTDAKIMSPSTLSKLQKIARNAILTKPDYQQLLPPSYETLYQLSGRDDDALEEKIISGEITNQTQQKDVRILFEGSDDESSVKKDADKTQETKDLLTIKCDFKKIPEDQLEAVKDILKQLRKLGFEISGIQLD